MYILSFHYKNPDIESLEGDSQPGGSKKETMAMSDEQTESFGNRRTPISRLPVNCRLAEDGNGVRKKAAVICA